MTNKVKGTCVPVEYLVLGMLENNVYHHFRRQGHIVWIPRASPTRSSRRRGLGRRHHPHASPFGPRGRCEGAARQDRRHGHRLGHRRAHHSGEKKLPRDDMRFTPCPVDHVVNDGDILKIGDMRGR